MDSPAWHPAIGLLRGASAAVATPPTISTTSLPDGMVGVAYSQSLSASGTGPITWSIVTGALPGWAVLVSGTGQIAGTASATGTSTFGVRATGPAGYDDQELSITIGGEGSAEIPIDPPVSMTVVIPPTPSPPRVQTMVVSITMAIDAAGTLQTVLLTNGRGWTTGAADTPAHAFVEGRVLEAGSYSRSMFAGRALFGAQQVSFGTIALANQDGQLDAWRSYGFDGRACTIYVGYEGDAFPSDWTKVVATEMSSVNVGAERVDLALRDPMRALERPVLRNRFAGTNGLEGPPALAGQPRPRCLGTTFFTPMILVDPSKLIYFVCDEASTASASSVYDGGAALTLGAEFASLSDLTGTTPSAGTARVYSAGPTYVRFGTAPTFEPTISRIGVYGGTMGRVLAAECGLTAHPTHTASPAFGEYVADSTTTYLAAMTAAYRQMPYFFGIDRDGRFVTRAVEDPAGGTPVATLNVHDVLSVARTTPTGIEVPVYRVSVRGNKNNSKGGTLAGAAVFAARQAFGSSSLAENTATLVKHPTAGEIVFELGGDPASSADAHLALHGVARDWIVCTLPLIPEWGALDLGDVVALEHPRIDLSSGRKFVVAGIDTRFAGQTVLNLWG